MFAAGANAAALEALVKQADLELPKALIEGELNRLVEGARADLKSRGIKDADKAPIPEEIFRPQAEKRVRMGLVVADRTVRAITPRIRTRSTRPREGPVQRPPARGQRLRLIPDRKSVV